LVNRTAIFGLIALVSAALLIIFSSTATATPTGSFQNISYNAGTSTLTWQLVLTNDSTAVSGASVAFAAPPGATATSTSGTGSCTGLPAGTPISCSIPAGGSLTINFSRIVQQLCGAQTITLGPVTISGGGVVGTVTVARTLANITATGLCSTGTTTAATYNVATQSVDWVVPTPASPNGPTTYQFILGSSDRNCPFISSFAPNICAGTGAAPNLTDVVTRITAASPAGICGTLPANVTLALYLCTIPAGSPAGSITLSLSMPQQCSEYVGGLPGYLFQTPGGVPTIVLGGFVGVPANLAACVAATTPTPPTQVPSTPVPPTPIVSAPPLVIIPQVFQHVPQGIFNGSRNNTPTPVRPREVGTAGSTGVGLAPAGAVPALLPPSTGDAGIPRLRLLMLNGW
jgi:hypothetical protein